MYNYLHDQVEKYSIYFNLIMQTIFYNEKVNYLLCNTVNTCNEKVKYLLCCTINTLLFHYKNCIIYMNKLNTYCITINRSLQN